MLIITYLNTPRVQENLKSSQTLIKLETAKTTSNDKKEKPRFHR